MARCKPGDLAIIVTRNSRDATLAENVGKIVEVLEAWVLPGSDLPYWHCRAKGSPLRVCHVVAGKITGYGYSPEGKIADHHLRPLRGELKTETTGHTEELKA